MNDRQTRVPSSKERRRTIVYLRGLLLVALGGLLFEAGAVRAGAGGVALLTAYSLSNLALLLVPLRSLRVELVVGAIDIIAVALAVTFAHAGSGVLPVSCLILVLVLALATCRSHALAGVIAICALHSWSLLTVGDGSARQLAPQLLFLGSLALYYGYLAETIHEFRKKESAEQLSLSELRTLLKILDSIASSPDLEHVTRVVVQKISEIVPAVRCSMLFIDSTKTRCFVIASHDNPDLHMLEMSLEKYPEVRHAIETKTPVLINDIASDPLMADVREILAELDLSSVMVVPMAFNEDLLGTLYMKTARGGHPFSEREFNFCTAVARAAAGALRNATLHRELVEASSRHREVAEKLSRIFDHSPDLLLTTDNEGRITEVNRAAEKMLGYERVCMLGLACDDIFGEEVAGLVARTLEHGLVANHSCRLRKKDGAWVDVELSTSALRNAAVTAGTVWLGRDVSELKETHRRLLQAERLSTVGEVISGVAHELNNPLCGVLGYSQLLLARHAGSTMPRELERIHDSALRCQKIVGNLLAFARGHKPERRYLGINGIIDKTVDIKKYQLSVHDIEIVREYDANLPRTLVDFHQLQQVLLNLFNNAQHAMTCERQRGGRLGIRTTHDGGTIRIEVSDTGHGMNSQTLERIFDPFFTTKEPGQGTGLGLSVSYGIINEHDGRIYARSQEGHGSTFVIELPIREEPVEHAQERSAKSPVAIAPGRGERILLVDDELMILDLLVEVLLGHGYRVDTASGGEEAWRKIDPSFDLVISDVRMPQMNGLDLHRRIMAVHPKFRGKMIFMTGDLLDRTTVEFLASVGARILQKPLEIDAVLTAVTETLAAETAEVSS